MKLKHIDNGFYFLTRHQARFLSSTGATPRPGHEVKASTEKLKGVTLMTRRPWGDWEERADLKPAEAKQAWIASTPLNY